MRVPRLHCYLGEPFKTSNAHRLMSCMYEGCSTGGMHGWRAWAAWSAYAVGAGDWCPWKMREWSLLMNLFISAASFFLAME